MDFENATTKLDQASKSWGDVENMPRPLTPSRLLQAHQRLREALARVREMEQVNALYSRDETCEYTFKHDHFLTNTYLRRTISRLELRPGPKIRFQIF